MINKYKPTKHFGPPDWGGEGCDMKVVGKFESEHELIRTAYMTALLLHPKLYLGEELSSFLEEDYWI